MNKIATKVCLISVLFITILNLKSLSQHPVPGTTPVNGTAMLYNGTLKYNNFGPTVPYIGDPWESKTGAWVSDYEDYHFYQDTLGFLNIRLLKPSGYDSLRSEPYPVIVMLHGAGESGRAWAGHYTFTPDDEEFDNNGRNLIHGAWRHWYAARQGYHPRRPSAPWTNEYSFDGIVIFPQVSYSGAWSTTEIAKVAAMLEDMVTAFNIDLNRIYTHGLSNGGKGVFTFMNQRPDLVAAASPHSAAGPTDSLANLASIPIFIVNGGKDSNPSPGYVSGTISRLEGFGADFIELPEGYAGEVNEDPYYPDQERFNSRHWLITNDGHGIWYEAYDRRDFFQWFLSKTKKDIFAVGGDTIFCPGSTFEVELRLSKGFKAYRWYKDNQLVTDSTKWNFFASDFGVYKVDYSRVANPGPGDWETSNTLEIAPFSGGGPSIIALSSTYLPSHVYTENSVILRVNDNGLGYEWYKDGILISGANTKELEVSEQGLYQAKMQMQGGCFSDLSAGIFVRTTNDPGSPSTPSNFTAALAGTNEIQLNWQDNADNETGYEIYGGISPDGPFNLITITPADTVSFLVQNLSYEKNYYFYLRAINDNGASDYAEAVMGSSADLIPPQLPDNLQIDLVTTDRIKITWSEAYDSLSGVDYYEVYLNDALVANVPQTEYTFTGLTANTVYTINLRVKDVAGNFSPMSSQLSAITSLVSKLDYDYYHTNGINSVDEIEGQTLIESDTIYKFIIDRSPLPQQPDYFAYIFKGLIKISEQGLYTFYTASDDGSKLYINGNLIVDNDFAHGVVEKSGSINLDTGYYPIIVRFFENAGGEALIVSYQSATIAKMEIPDTVLFRYDPSLLPPAPSKPAGLSASANADGFISLTWNNQADETGFEIYRSEVSGGPYTIIGTTAQDVISFVDRNVVPGTTYYYVIKAKNSGGVSVPSDEVWITAPAQSLPSAPTGLTAQIRDEWGEPVIDLSWTAGSNTRSFIIERSAGDESNYLQVGKVDGGVTVFADDNLAANVNYYYRVKAENAVGEAISSSISIQSTPVRYLINLTTYGIVEGGVWNDFSFKSGGSGPAPIGTKKSNLNDNYFNESKVEIVLADLFEKGENYGLTNGALFPPNVMNRYHYVGFNGDTLGKFQINGLMPGIPYNFYIMSSSTKSLSKGLFTIGNQTIFFDARNNKDQLVQFSNIIPDVNGSVILEIRPNAPDERGLINALVIERGDPTAFQDYYARANSDVSKLYNWGIYPDGTGGRLKSFGEPNKNLHITADSHLYENIKINGTGTKTLIDNNTNIQVQSAVNTIEFSNLEIAPNTQVNVTGVGDTCNVKIIQGDLVLGSNSVLDIDNNTLTLLPGTALNPGDSTGLLGFHNGNLIMQSGNDKTHYLYLQATRDSIFNISADLGTTASAVLTLRSRLNLTGKLQILSGYVLTGGNLALISNKDFDASIAKIIAPPAIVGNVEVQRYFGRSPGTYGFFYLGTPVENQTVGDWDDDFYILGIGSGYGNLKFYDEPTASWVGMTSYTDPIPPGKGVNAFIFSQDFADGFVHYDNTNFLTQGDFSFNNLSYTTSSPDSGWNLVANPYPSTIDWSLVNWGDVNYVNRVNTAFYTWDQANGGFQVWTPATTASPLIAKGQGFFIRTNNDNATAIKLIVTEDIKADTTVAFLRKAEKGNIMEIVAVDPDSHIDRGYISLFDDATYEFDSYYDAEKLMGNYINIYSVGKEGDYYAVNTLPTKRREYRIPLGIKASSKGDFTLTFNNLDSYGEEYELTLIDNYTGNTHELSDGFVYEFALSDDTASYGDQRFMILINADLPFVQVSGKVTSVYEEPLPGTKIGFVADIADSVGAVTDEDGLFNAELLAGEQYQAMPEKQDVYSFNKVNLLDYIQLIRFVYNRRVNLTDFEYLAADLDASGKINKRDLKLMRDVIVSQFFGKPQSFSWRFLTGDYTLERKGKKYLLDDGLGIMPEGYTDKSLEISGLVPGDVYARVGYGGFMRNNPDEGPAFIFGEPIVDEDISRIPVFVRNFKNVKGFQLSIDKPAVSIYGSAITFESDEIVSLPNGNKVLIWASKTDADLSLEDGALLFFIQSKDLNDKDLKSFTGYMANARDEIINLAIEKAEGIGVDNPFGFNVYPNPFRDEFNITLQLNNPEVVKFLLFDGQGKLMHSVTRELAPGLHELGLQRDLGFHGQIPKGVYILNFMAGEQFISEKLIKQ